MDVLLHRQQAKQQAAAAVGLALRHRTEVQLQQQQAESLRWQWCKVHGFLRRQELTLSLELQQLLVSGELLEFAWADTARVQRTERMAEATPSTGNASYQATEHSIASALEGLNVSLQQLESEDSNLTDSQHQLAPLLSPRRVETPFLFNNKSTVLSLCSSLRPFGRFAKLLECSCVLVRLMKQSSTQLSLADLVVSSKETALNSQQEHVSCCRSNDICIHTPWQLASCMFQFLSSTLHEEKTTLDRSCCEAAADVASAISNLKQQGILPQTQAVTMHQRSQRRGDQESLTDEEDSILCGEASLVIAARDAAAKLKNAIQHSANKLARRSQRHTELREMHTELRNMHADSISVNSKQITSRRTRSSSSDFRAKRQEFRKSSCMHSSNSSWRDLLKDYSKRLVELEEEHRKQLQNCQREHLLHRMALRGAVSRLMRNASATTISDAHLNNNPGERRIQNPRDGVQGLNSLAEPLEELEEDRGQKKHVLRGSKLPSVALLSTTGESKDIHHHLDEERNSIISALMTVRWLSMASRCEGMDGDEQARCFFIRLQLVFPLADEKDLKQVVVACQQLNLLSEREMTCRRVWAGAREQELKRIKTELQRVTFRELEAAKSTKASLALMERRNQLWDKLTRQRKQREEEECQLAVAALVERETQLAREVDRARREKIRRKKEKISIAAYRQRKQMEIQQQQQQKAREAEEEAEKAAAGLSHINLLRAARVARRQEQHNLRLLKLQLGRQERQLQEEMLQQRLLVAASKLKPLVDRDPVRIYRQTFAAKAHAEAAIQRKETLQTQMHYRLGSFAVTHTYSCDALMHDLRFRLSTTLAENHLVFTEAAQELLLSMSQSIEETNRIFPSSSVC